MTDINSRIEATKNQVLQCRRQLEQVQTSKRDMTLSQVAKPLLSSLATLKPSIKSRRVLKGHFGKVMALHWGKDYTLVTASQDGNLLIWNAVTANKLQAISLKSSYVMSVCLEQSRGQLVACGGLDNLCTIYKRNEPHRAMEMASHDGFLSCCRFLSEEQILTGSGDSTCIHWDIATSKPISTMTEHTADVMYLSLKPQDKNVFASCSVDQTIKIWDIRTPGKAALTFFGHTGDVNGVEFMPSDGNVVVSSSQDNTVRLFDLRAYNEIQRFTAPASAVAPPSDGAAISEMDEEGPDGFTSLGISRSGRVVFGGHADGSIYAYDVLSGRAAPLYSLTQAHERAVSCVGVSPQGNALASGGWDSAVKIWA